jgi:acyl-coenzyme A thioesterase PaaI-like protein
MPYLDEVDLTPRRDPVRRCVDAIREIGTRLVEADLSPGAATELQRLLDEARSVIATGSHDRPPSVPDAEVHPWIGRSNPLAPPMRFHTEDDLLVGFVTCSRAYAGSAPWVHGGVIAGLFDAVIATRGAMAGSAITANLVIDYRAPVPIGRTLRLEAGVDRIEGRKCNVTARMLDADADALLAEATALLLTPRDQAQEGPPAAT